MKFTEKFVKRFVLINGKLLIGLPSEHIQSRLTIANQYLQYIRMRIFSIWLAYMFNQI